MQCTGLLTVRSILVCPPVHSIFYMDTPIPFSEWDPSFFRGSDRPMKPPRFLQCRPKPKCPSTIKASPDSKIKLCNDSGQWEDVVMCIPKCIGEYEINGDLQARITYQGEVLPLEIQEDEHYFYVYLNLPPIPECTTTITIVIEVFCIPVKYVCKPPHDGKIIICVKTNLWRPLL